MRCSRSVRNYLRVRGEYLLIWRSCLTCTELPPRARRIHRDFRAGDALRGTTSACAENTGLHPCPCKSARNYLRVRGEYHLASAAGHFGEELPPRARRILLPKRPQGNQRGTTSACAENTQRTPLGLSWERNYLRVRGEYDAKQRRARFRVELPPRARRILFATGRRQCRLGTTSACAENTLNELGLL